MSRPRSQITRQRVCIAQVLGDALGSEVANYRVNSSATPWHFADPPCLVVAHDSTLGDPAEAGTACTQVVRYQVLLVAGAYGADHAMSVIDWWAEVMLTPGVLAPCVDHPDWPPGCAAAPTVTEVGGARLYELPNGRFTAAMADVKSEIHFD